MLNRGIDLDNNIKELENIKSKELSKMLDEYNFLQNLSLKNYFYYEVSKGIGNWIFLLSTLFLVTSLITTNTTLWLWLLGFLCYVIAGIIKGVELSKK